jgi:hypothetical protein
MRGYTILTNRKRTIIALVHTVVFLLLAMYGLVTVVRPLQTASPASSWTVAAIYVLVTVILLVLAAVAGNSIERLYFALCTTSAAFGLARQLLGDPRMHSAVYIRIAMLACAVLAGMAILRGYREAVPAAVE